MLRSANKSTRRSATITAGQHQRPGVLPSGTAHLQRHAQHITTCDRIGLN